MKKVEQCKGLEERITEIEQESKNEKTAKEELQKEFDSQKLAYEAVLESMGKANEQKEELDELKKRFEELEGENKRLSEE